MRKKISIEFERNGISCKVHGNVAVFTISCDAFEALTNVDTNRDILDWFDLVEEDPDIRAILTLNEPDCLGNKAYNKFLSEVSGKQIDINNPEAIAKFQKTQTRAVAVNMLMNYIKKIISFKKIYAVGIQGEAVTPFFGLSLAGDFRYGDKSTIFSLSHIKYSIHPSGALPFFLPRYVGQAKTMELLFTGGDIHAEQAYELGLLNKIFDSENFLGNCLNELKPVLHLSKQYMKVTKLLSNYYAKDLEKYFEIESNYLFS